MRRDSRRKFQSNSPKNTTKLDIPLFQHTKFQKVLCGGSGKSGKIDGMKCSVKHVSRYISYLNAIFEFNRTLEKGFSVRIRVKFSEIFFILNFRIQTDFKLWHKTYGSNYRQLININNLDFCKVVGYPDIYPLYKPSLDYLNLTYPGNIHKCPYSVRIKSSLFEILL